jgi:hypothetical protein
MAGHDAHYYRVADGTGLPHDPLNAIIGPRPIGWISSLSAAGVPNLAPYSFFNAFNYRPPLIGFSSLGWKDSVANIDSTGEFVWKPRHAPTCGGDERDFRVDSLRSRRIRPRWPHIRGKRSRRATALRSSADAAPEVRRWAAPTWAQTAPQLSRHH